MTTQTAVIAALIALLGTVITVVGGLVLARILRPKELIDTLTKRVELAEDQAEKADKKADAALLRQRYWEDYVGELRSHIEARNPPPPPRYPPELLRIHLEV